jgi:hypothetical protein
MLWIAGTIWVMLLSTDIQQCTLMQIYLAMKCHNLILD